MHMSGFINKRLFLKRIANHLIVNTSGLDNIGLYYGKMGIVLFFVHYARYVENLVYEDYASELLDEVYEDICDETPLNFSNGLCGIGWSILYLLENNLMTGDPDQILIDVDKRIMEWDLSRLTDFSMETGLKGLSCYIKKRVDVSSRLSGQKPFDESYLLSWKKSIMHLSDEKTPKLLSFISEEVKFDDELQHCLLGLHNGCAGCGLQLMSI